MSESLFSADRNTHVRIVAVALIAVTAAVMVAIYARATDPGAATAGVHADRPVLKAGQPATYTDSDQSRVR